MPSMPVDSASEDEIALEDQKHRRPIIRSPNFNAQRLNVRVISKDIV